ncbi:hypothetical protein [Nonomuraea longicatena]|uniref:Phage tail family protein n=1 Tax=Nonomuraea longicatena TaxID=83682 RepID=A0ABP4BVR2_9ACTN
MARTRVELATPSDVAAGTGGVYTSSYTLTTGQFAVLPGMKGFDMPPYEIKYDEMVAIDGGYLRNVRTPARELFIPIYMEAANHGDLLALKRAFLAAIQPTKGACRITLTEEDGSRRYIDAYYFDGARGDEGQEVSGVEWLKWGLIFRALDPYFYSGTSQTIRFSTGELDLHPFFGAKFLNRPMLNKAHSLNGESTITVTGDVDTYPTWTIHGPATGMTFIRKFPGRADQSFSLNVSLTDTQAILVDTRPGTKSVRDIATGANLWEFLAPGPQLWPISPGSNTVAIDVRSAGVDTSVSLSYLPRFLSA